MRIFVSSRLEELGAERKRLIEAIHGFGHTPIFIENHPDVTDETSKAMMDELMASSDAFVSIHYLTLGKVSKPLGNRTPTQYEFEHFKLTSDKPSLFLCKDADSEVRPSERLSEWIKETVRTSDPAWVTISHLNVATSLEDALKEWLDLIPKIPERDEARYVIRYSGEDRVGLINFVTGVLGYEYGVNITYISQAARSGVSTIYISGSCPKKWKREYLKANLKERFERGSNDPPFEPLKDFTLEVTMDTSRHPRYHLYLEIRTIDSPGELNGISKILSRRGLNIDEIILKPTEWEHQRQSLLCLWLSYPILEGEGTIDFDVVSNIYELESELQTLMGVRAFTSRLIDYDRSGRRISTAVVAKPGQDQGPNIG